MPIVLLPASDLMLPLKILYPEINWNQHLDFKLQQDTPTMLGKPIVAVWLRQPDRLDTGILAKLDIDLVPLLITPCYAQISDIAIMIDDSALTTFTTNLMPVNQLPHQEDDRLNINGLPLSIMLYNEKLTPEDISLMLLGVARYYH